MSEPAAKPGAGRNFVLLCGFGLAGWLLLIAPEVGRTFLSSGLTGAGLALVRLGGMLLASLVNYGFWLGVPAGLLLLAANRDRAKGDGGSWMPAFGLLPASHPVSSDS